MSKQNNISASESFESNTSNSKDQQTRDNSLVAALYKRDCRGKPFVDRSQSKAAVNALATTSHRPPLSNVYGSGPILLSDIPVSSTREGVIVGIDEAGRGCVLGPMVYGASFWNEDEQAKVPRKDLDDSKALTAETRSTLFRKIVSAPDVGFAVRVLHASEISRNMLRKEPYNLNQMSHNAAISLIRSILDAGVKIRTCYIDTVGTPHVYQRLLERTFSGVEFVVESKADAKYAPCSAASIVAKVVRDRMLDNWEFTEPNSDETHKKNFGSGYPSDPACKKWMEEHLFDKIFGFPDLVRFSWGPAKKLMHDSVSIEFAGDDDEDETSFGTKRQQEQMNAFLGRKGKKRRLPYFEASNLEVAKIRQETLSAKT